MCIKRAAPAEEMTVARWINCHFCNLNSFKGLPRCIEVDALKQLSIVHLAYKPERSQLLINRMSGGTAASGVLLAFFGLQLDLHGAY